MQLNIAVIIIDDYRFEVLPVYKLKLLRHVHTIICTYIVFS